MKIVLDTNVFISGIFWKGFPYQIIKLAEEDRIEIYTTFEILQELFGVLERRKFDELFEEGRTSRQEVFQKVVGLVKTCLSTIKVNLIKEDPPDNNVLSCAISCGASFIVSGDKHLLKLTAFQGIPILTPRQFLN
jgi:putative PIN family toxin of toxin-antitoxin system